MEDFNKDLEKAQYLLDHLKGVEVKIATVFEKYGYSSKEYQVVLRQLSGVAFYKSPENIFSYSVEALLKEALEAYIFISENDGEKGITLRSNKYSNQVVVKNYPTILTLKQAISADINKYVDELDEVRGIKTHLANEYGKEKPTPQEILAFLNNNNINSYHYKMDDSCKVIVIYNILRCVNLICRELNQKNTTAISNKECALIYDIYTIVEGLKDDSTKTTKEKTNFIKPRIKKKLNANMIE